MNVHIMDNVTRDLSALLSLTSSKDKQAFAELYNSTNMKLFGVCLRILRKQEVAEEILQEVYVKIWHRAGDYQSERGSPISWMCAIARNHALDEVRKRRMVFVDDAAGIDNVPDPANSPEGELEVSDEMRRLNQCLSQLEKPKREAVILAYLEGCSRAELAERFGQPVGTIKTWLHRSLKNLKDCLAL